LKSLEPPALKRITEDIEKDDVRNSSLKEAGGITHKCKTREMEKIEMEVLRNISFEDRKKWREGVQERERAKEERDALDELR